MAEEEWSPYEQLRWTTLWELWAEPGIWEPFWDAPNYFPHTTAREDLIEESRRLLRELYSEGWATFVRRPWGEPTADGDELRPEEVEAAISESPWHEVPLAGTVNVWLRPTSKALAWKEWSAYEAFGKDEGWAQPEVERVDDLS